MRHPRKAAPAVTIRSLQFSTAIIMSNPIVVALNVANEKVNLDNAGDIPVPHFCFESSSRFVEVGQRLENSGQTIVFVLTLLFRLCLVLFPLPVSQVRDVSEGAPKIRIIACRLIETR